MRKARKFIIETTVIKKQVTKVTIFRLWANFPGVGWKVLYFPNNIFGDIVLLRVWVGGFFALRYGACSISFIQSSVSSAFTARSASWISLLRLCLRLNSEFGCR